MATAAIVPWKRHVEPLEQVSGPCLRVRLPRLVPFFNEHITDLISGLLDSNVTVHAVLTSGEEWWPACLRNVPCPHRCSQGPNPAFLILLIRPNPCPYRTPAAPLPCTRLLRAGAATSACCPTRVCTWSSASPPCTGQYPVGSSDHKEFMCLVQSMGRHEVV